MNEDDKKLLQHFATFGVDLSLSDIRKPIKKGKEYKYREDYKVHRSKAERKRLKEKNNDTTN